MGAVDKLKKFLRRTQWNLSHPDRGDLVLFQWERGFVRPGLVHVAWRLVLAGYFLGWRFYRWTNNDQYEMLYYTNWGFTVITCDAFVKFLVTLYELLGARRFFESESRTGLPIFLKISWVLSSITHASALMVTITYWSLIYEGPGVTTSDVVVHLTNSIYAVLETATNRRPVFLGHVWHTWVYTAVYAVFTAVYYLAGGKANSSGDVFIYWFLDWSKPGVTIGFMPVFLLAPVIFQVLLMGLARLRDRLWAACFGAREEALFTGSVSVPKTFGGDKLVYSLSDKV